MSGVGEACQSCGMTLDKEELLGTNKDGSLSKLYCNYCYQDGAFTDQGITLQEKIKKSIKIAVENGFSQDVAEEMVKKTVPDLKRWKK